MQPQLWHIITPVALRLRERTSMSLYLEPLAPQHQALLCNKLLVVEIGDAQLCGET